MAFFPTLLFGSSAFLFFFGATLLVFWLVSEGIDREKRDNLRCTPRAISFFFCTRASNKKEDEK